VLHTVSRQTKYETPSVNGKDKVFENGKTRFILIPVKIKIQE
jgi:hypothetical protein